MGQKRDRYLPMEVCTIIPCQKRHLSEQQTATMIRSTARPAPERQRDIQYWVCLIIQFTQASSRSSLQRKHNYHVYNLTVRKRYCKLQITWQARFGRHLHIARLSLQMFVPLKNIQSYLSLDLTCICPRS